MLWQRGAGWFGSVAIHLILMWMVWQFSQVPPVSLEGAGAAPMMLLGDPDGGAAFEEAPAPAMREPEPERTEAPRVTPPPTVAPDVATPASTPKPNDVIIPKDEPTPSPTKATPKPTTPAPTPEPTKATPTPTKAPETPKPTKTPEPTKTKAAPKATTAAPTPEPTKRSLSREDLERLREKNGVTASGRAQAPSTTNSTASKGSTLRTPGAGVPGARSTAPRGSASGSPLGSPNGVPGGKALATAGGTAMSAEGGISLPPSVAKGALEQIRRYFNVPDTMKDPSACVVAFTWAKDGTVSQVAVRQSSGSRERDELAKQAVVRAERLSPLPASVNKASVRVEVTFRFTD